MKKTLFVLAGLLISTIAATAANLLPADASKFDNGSWGSWEVWGNKAKVEIAAPGYNDSEGCLKLTNPKDALIEGAQAAYEFDAAFPQGQEFTVKFYAKASKAGAKLQVVLQNHTTLNEVSFGAFSLTEDWQRYEATFPALADADFVRVLLSFGEDAADYYIDYVSVGEAEALEFPDVIYTEEANLEAWTRTFTSGSNGSWSRNTWSTENDASAVRTPFIETWVAGGSGAKLSPMVIQHQTVEGLTPGKYQVKLTARAYNEQAGSSTPSGVKFIANGEEVDLSTGQQFTFNNMAGVWDNFVVPAEVGEDGKLDFSIEIYDSNLSWLAFKNFEIVYLNPVAPEIPLVTSKLGAAADKAQKEALKDFQAFNDAESYAALQAAHDAALKSAAFYAQFQPAIEALDEAGAELFASTDIAEAFNEGTLDESNPAAVKEAIAAAQKVQTTPGSSLSFVGGKTQADWTGATGYYQNDYVERYSGDAYQPGKILYQTIEGLVPGAKYEVQFLATANMAWIGAATGSGIAQLFVNDKTYDIDVLDQTGCNPRDYLRQYKVTADAEGKIQYGIQNVAVGGNWYVAQFVDLTYLGAAYPQFAADEDYYLMNLETGTWLGGANSWGTQASLIKHPSLNVTLTLQDGKYSINSHTYNNANQHFLGTNGYIDSDETFWTIEEVEENTYTLNVDGAYLQYDGSSNVLQVAAGADPTQKAAQWVFIPKSVLLQALEAGKATDATFLIKAADFSRNQYNANFEGVWTVEAANCNLSGGNNTNNCAESWRSSNGFNVYQTLTNIPNGVYVLNAQASVCDYDQTFEDLPVVYANDMTSIFNLSSQVDRQNDGENSMSEMSESFTAGKYAIAPIRVVVTDGTLTIGVKSSRTSIWAVWDNFELSYLGEEIAPKYDMSAISGVGQCYEGIAVGVDAEDVKEIMAYLGVESVDEIQMATKAPDGSYVTANNGRGETDGWRNADGEFVTWGTEGFTYYVQPYASLDGFGAYMGSAPDAITEPTTITAPVFFQANGKEVEIVCGLDYVMMYFAEAKSVIGSCYENIEVGVTEEEVAAIKAYLGVENDEDVTILTFTPEGEDVTANNGRGETDGWRNADGEFVTWGTEGFTYYVQPYYYGAVMGTAPDAITEETTIENIVAFKANDKIAYVVVSLVYEPDATKINVVEEVNVNIVHNYDNGYEGPSNMLFDTSMVEDAIGVTPAEATIYAWNPTTDEYVLNAMTTYDGWHNAAGDCEVWGANATHFVKFLANGTYSAGTYPGQTDKSAIYKAYWLFVNTATGDAVKYIFTMKHSDDAITGIENIAVNKADNSKIFDLAGRQVSNPVKGGIYIQNGKKVILK